MHQPEVNNDTECPVGQGVIPAPPIRFCVLPEDRCVHDDTGDCTKELKRLHAIALRLHCTTQVVSELLSGIEGQELCHSLE